MDTGEAWFAALADGIDDGVGATPAVSDPELARMGTIVAALRRTSSRPPRIRRHRPRPGATAGPVPSAASRTASRTSSRPPAGLPRTPPGTSARIAARVGTSAGQGPSPEFRARLRASLLARNAESPPAT
jgi:hypothetical protein